MELSPSLPEDFPYHLIVNGENYKFSKLSVHHLFFQTNGHVIWGLTAKIISNVVDILKKRV